MSSVDLIYHIWFENQIVSTGSLPVIRKHKFVDSFMYVKGTEQTEFFYKGISEPSSIGDVVEGTDIKYQTRWVVQNIIHVPKEFLLQLNLEGIR